MRDFRKYVIWQKAIELTDLVYSFTDTFPKSEVYALSNQLQRAAVSIASNIAEGASRSSDKDFAHFLEMAIGSAFEIETQLTIAQRRGYITLKAYVDALSEISIFNEFTGTTPVLLLDDIFSELDVRKRNKLLKIIGASDIQSIITTTDLKNINKKFVETACVFKVDNGNVERK